MYAMQTALRNLRQGGAFFAVALCFASALPADAVAQGITLPIDGDDYSRLVARADAGDQAVDFRALRLAWLDSAARKRSAAANTRQLRGDLFAAVPTNDAEKIAAAARQVLSAIYIDMDAQKLLRQACTVLKDQACADRHHFVEFGLLKSIMMSGDGKSCETGWQAVSIDEEYFVLRIEDLKRDRQALITGPHTCDRLDATDAKGNTHALFFNIDAFIRRELD